MPCTENKSLIKKQDKKAIEKTATLLDQVYDMLKIRHLFTYHLRESFTINILTMPNSCERKDKHEQQKIFNHNDRTWFADICT
jgi:hypothetical protein